MNYDSTKTSITVDLTNIMYRKERWQIKDILCAVKTNRKTWKIAYEKKYTKMSVRLQTIMKIITSNDCHNCINTGMIFIHTVLHTSLFKVFNLKSKVFS